MTQPYRLEVIDNQWLPKPIPKAIWHGQRLVCDFTDDDERATLQEAAIMCAALNATLADPRTPTRLRRHQNERTSLGLSRKIIPGL